MIKKHRIIKSITISALVLSLAACTTTRHGRGIDSDDADAMGANGNGAYAEGTGAGGGFQPSASCNVPQVGGKTTAYYFEYDKSDVHPDDMGRLQTIAGNAAANHKKVRVVGNTDNRGSREYNIALGWRRANSVASTLEQGGVSKQQIDTTSYGAEKPIAFGNSEDDFQCNRRVDVTER